MDRTKLLKEAKVDALLITNVPNIIYLTSYPGFSIEEREAYLLLTYDEQFIFTDARYSEAVINTVPHFLLKEINHKHSLLQHLQDTLEQNRVKTLGFESHSLTVAEYARLKKGLTVKLKPTNNLIEKIRAIKNKEEIEKIKKACALGDKAFSYILKHIKRGMTEKEVAFTLDSFIRKSGATNSFSTIIGFGANGSIPHHLSSNVTLANQHSILMDFGVRLDNYCSDMTRTVFLSKPTSEEAKVYEAVLQANEKAIEFVKQKYKQKKKVSVKKVDGVARRHILDQGYPSIPHSLGHGVGIEVHEAPRLSPNSKEVLKSGMIFSIEPGIYIPGKIGVRIEDLVALEDDKIEVLTKSSKEIIIL